MNTQQIADEMVRYNREGKFPQVYQDLFHPDFVSIEMPGVPNEVVQGLEEVIKKGEQWMSQFEEFEAETSDPMVAENWFAVTFDMKTKHKETGEVTQGKELGVYHVEDGKIVQEQFFYDM